MHYNYTAHTRPPCRGGRGAGGAGLYKQQNCQQGPNTTITLFYTKCKVGRWGRSSCVYFLLILLVIPTLGWAGTPRYSGYPVPQVAVRLYP